MSAKHSDDELAATLREAVADELGDGYDVSASVKSGHSEVVCGLSLRKRGPADATADPLPPSQGDPQMTTDETKTTTPWPHGWRAGMRLLPLPGMWPALLVRRVLRSDGHAVELRAVDGAADESDSEFRIYTAGLAVQPDLDDGPTKGALLEMVRERSGHSAAYADEYLEDEDEDQNGWCVNAGRHSHRILVVGHATEGGALKAALDHLAAIVKHGADITSTAGDCSDSAFQDLAALFKRRQGAVAKA